MPTFAANSFVCVSHSVHLYLYLHIYIYKEIFYVYIIQCYNINLAITLFTPLAGILVPINMFRNIVGCTNLRVCDATQVPGSCGWPLLITPRVTAITLITPLVQVFCVLGRAEMLLLAASYNKHRAGHD